MMSGAMIRFALILIFVGLLPSSQVRGRRVLRVRKTGEFGKRITLSQSYQLPQQFSQDLSAESTQFSGHVFRIKKPSQQLELPFPEDSITAETGHALQGYSFPDFETEQEFERSKHPAAAEYTEAESTEEEQVDFPPTKVYPDSPKPVQAETEVNSDSENTGPNTGIDHKSAGLSARSEVSNEQNEKCEDDGRDCGKGYQAEIPGEAGKDYPILREIVDTSFDCENVPFSGYYADSDPQARCQIFHICLKGNENRKGQKWSFLCPNGTIFSQGDFVCVWWHSAPECSSGVVDELSLRNAELGWDNTTEPAARGADGNYNSASFRNSQIQRQQQSGGNRSNNGKKKSPSARTAIPYRVPVIENERTRLKEVTGNGINSGQESFADENGSFETSLRQESETRHRSKTSSALRRSESEAYEQKSNSDGIGLRPQANSGPQDFQDLQTVQSDIEEKEAVTSGVVMMPPQQINPDGPESFAEVPVMMQAKQSGYRYPAPSKPFLITTELPTTTTRDESVSAEFGEYQIETTQETVPDKARETTTFLGYNYPVPTMPPELAGYKTETTIKGPLSTDDEIDSRHTPMAIQDDQKEVNGYETSTASVTEATEISAPNLEPESIHIPPTTERGYSRTPVTPDPDVLPISTPANLLGEEKTESVAVATGSVPEELQSHGVTDGNSIMESEDIVGLSGGSEAPTASPSGVGGSPTEAHLGTLTQLYLPSLREQLYAKKQSSELKLSPKSADSDNQENVNRILQEIRNGGAEVRDENGKTLDIEQLQKIIESTPSGILSLQRADDSVTTDASSPDIEEETEPEHSSVLKEVETIEEIPKPSRTYLPQQQPQVQRVPHESHFSNDRLVSIKRPEFEISAPSKEYETHSILKNVGGHQQSPVVSNPFSAFTTFPNEQVPQLSATFETPTLQPFQNFNTKIESPQLYYQTQPPQNPQSTRNHISNVILDSSPTNQPIPPFPYQNQGYHRPQSQDSPQEFQRITNEYLLPRLTQPQSLSQFIQGSKPTQYLSSVPPTQSQNRELLDNDIHIHQSLPSQENPYSSGSHAKNANIQNPLNIKIVPALLVNTHTRVELPNGDVHHDGRQLLRGNGDHYSQFIQQRTPHSASLPYSSQSENVPVKVRAPRLNPFTFDDALPKREKFTLEESRSPQEIMKYRSRGELGNPGLIQHSSSNVALRFQHYGTNQHLDKPSLHNSFPTLYPRNNVYRSQASRF